MGDIEARNSDRFEPLSLTDASECTPVIAAISKCHWSQNYRTLIKLPEPNRRLSAMFVQFKKIARALRVPNVADTENAYLNDAMDRFDLEYRQRQVDRGMFRRQR